VTNAEGKIKSTEARLKKLKEELDHMTVKSPRDGIALYGDPDNEWMRREIKVGARWGSGNTLFTLPDMKEMQLVVRINEADISMIKKEMDAIVTVEAFKGRTFKGKVTEIASTASDNWDSGARTFRVEITIEPFTDIEMRAGTTAKAEIQVEELKDVVYLPIHAVFAEEGAHFCFMPKAGGFEKREVKVGKNNLHYVEALEGLKEGELVLLYDPRGTSQGESKGDKDKDATPLAGVNSAAESGGNGASKAP
jgi:RND family efflux transporter MFP subunit